MGFRRGRKSRKTKQRVRITKPQPQTFAHEPQNLQEKKERYLPIQVGKARNSQRFTFHERIYATEPSWKAELLSWVIIISYVVVI